MLTTTLSPILEFYTELQCRYGAQDWDELLLPEIERQQEPEKEVVFRADAAFAKPEIYEALEERGVKYGKPGDGR